MAANDQRVIGELMNAIFRATRRAERAAIIIHKCAVGRLDLLPGGTVRPNTTAHWMIAKPIVSVSYCTRYTSRVAVFAKNVQLCCD